MLKQRIDRICALFLADPAVRYALLSKLAAFGFGPLTILFLGTFLKPTEQGVYYVFGSLLQLRTFVDLGFSQSAQQLLSHAFGPLAIGRKTGITGEPEGVEAFVEIARLVFRIYHVLGLLTILLLGFGGHAYLAQSLEGLPVDWRGPWWAMVLSLGFGVGFQGAMTFSDGANRLAITNKWRFISELSGIVIFLAFLRSGGGLWASAAFSWTRCILTTFPIGIGIGMPAFRQVMAAKAGGFSYRTGVLPLQLRNLIASGMGFFIFYAYNPMSLSLRGALVAAIVGMSMQIGNLVQNFSTIWFDAQIPLMGNLAGSGKAERLASLHQKGMKITAFGWVAVSSIVMICAATAKKLWPAFGDRYGTLPELGVFLLGTAGFIWCHIRGAYIRAHRIEPFAPLAVIQAISTIILLWFLLPSFGTMGAAICFAITMGAGALWVEIVYRAYRKRFT